MENFKLLDYLINKFSKVEIYIYNKVYVGFNNRFLRFFIFYDL